MSTDTTTAVVVAAQNPEQGMVDGHSGMAAAMVYGEAVGQYYCSMPKDHPELDNVLWKCRYEPTSKVADMIGTTVTIQHIYGRQATFVDEATGEETAGTISCFITPDLHVYSCASNGIRGSIADILRQYGRPEAWKEPITAVIRQLTFGKKRMFALQVVKAPPAKVGKK